MGNITSKSDGTSTIAYTYGTDSDAGWSKLLTSYNGETIDYDAIGNPTTYRGASLTWNGRQLDSYSKDGTSITYKYDADGLRGSKTVNGTKTTYQYLDGKLYYQETNGNDTYFYYDSYGNITAISYYPDGGSLNYVFVGTNSLGDVNALYNANGDLLVKYEYDAWGNVIAETDANGNALTGTAAAWSQLNPFRYRGYVYDTETGLYYLQSRYYDPEVGRFLNSDAIANTADSLGFNTYAYCGNNPVNCIDPTGHFGVGTLIGAAIGGFIGGACGAITALCKGQSVKAGIVTGAITGAIVGGVCGSVADAVSTGGLSVLAGIAITSVVGGLAYAGGNVLNQYWNYTVEKESYLKNETSMDVGVRNNTNAPVLSHQELSSKYESFSDYVDIKSVVVSGISGAIFSPIGMGGNCVVNSAFVGLETGVANRIGQIIANFAIGGNIAVLQSSIDLF